MKTQRFEKVAYEVFNEDSTCVRVLTESCLRNDWEIGRRKAKEKLSEVTERSKGLHVFQFQSQFEVTTVPLLPESYISKYHDDDKSCH